MVECSQVEEGRRTVTVHVPQVLMDWQRSAAWRKVVRGFVEERSRGVAANYAGMAHAHVKDAVHYDDDVVRGFGEAIFPEFWQCYFHQT